MSAKSLSIHSSLFTFKPWILAAALPAAMCFGCGDESLEHQSNAMENPSTMVNPGGTEMESQGGSEIEALEYTIEKSERAHDESPEVSEEEFSRHISGNRNLSFELHREATPDQANVMLSAWSIRQAFALVIPGVSDEVQAVIAETLGLSPDGDTSLRSINLLNDELNSRQLEEYNDQAPVVLKTANTMWANTGEELDSTYLDQISEHLDAGIHLIDFKNHPEEARQTINSWVENATENRIQDLIPENQITRSTKSVFTNAVYFKAPWYEPFNVENTTDLEFITLNGEEITTPMMRGEKNAPAAIIDGTQVLTLPFRGQELSITFLMPMEGSLEALETNLTASRWEEFMNQRVNDLRMVTIPKFKFETSVRKLSDYFLERETRVLFGSPVIDSIFVDQEISMSEIMHKSFIEINETGGEAAAATAIIARSPSVPEYGPEVVIDRAFLFAIHDESTGAILFFGRVGNPAE